MPRFFTQEQGEAIGFVWEVLLSILVPVAAFAFAGRWLDHRFHTHPWFLGVSFPCALAVAYVIIRRKAEAFRRKVYPDDV